MGEGWKIRNKLRGDLKEKGIDLNIPACVREKGKKISREPTRVGRISRRRVNLALIFGK